MSSATPRRPPNAGKGRKPGVPNKATADVRAAAREYSAEALETLAGIMRGGKQPAAARVAAAKELLDRAFGKSTQPLANDPENPLTGPALDFSTLTLEQVEALAAITLKPAA